MTPTFEQVTEDFVHAHAKLYGTGAYDLDRKVAEKNMEILKKGAVSEHYKGIASRTNAKKGFGSNKQLAKTAGARGGRSGKKQTK